MGLVIQQDGVTSGTCPYCGEWRDAKDMHIEHIVPWATLKAMFPQFRQNRAQEIDLYHYWDGSAPTRPNVHNLTLACPHCNMSKGKQPLKTWRGGKHLH